MNKPPPLSDSPWYWLYLFATSALIGLALIQPKFEQRQAQIERQQQGRARAEQVKQGQDATVEMSTPEHRHWNLRPLFQVLSGAAIIGWIVFWWRRRSSAASVANEPATEPDSSSTEPSP